MMRTLCGSCGWSHRQTAALSSPNVAERPARRTVSRLFAGQPADQAAKVRTALGADERMQLVDDDERERRKDFGKTMRVIHEERLDRLGCDQEHARGVLEQAALGRCGDVAVPFVDGDLRLAAELFQTRELVVDQRLERADVDGADAAVRARASMRDRIGRNAASVFPAAVRAAMIRSPVPSKISWIASTWMGRSFVHFIR